MRIQITKLYNGNFNFLILLFYCFILLLLSFIINKTLLTKEFYFKSFGNMQKETIEQMLDIKQKWSWISYLLIPFKLILKISIVALVFKIGFTFNNIDIKFVKLFNVVTISETIFILYSCIITFFALHIKTLEELQSFPTFSICSLITKNNLPSYLNYLFRNLNLIEVIYWLVLAYGLSIITSKKYINMLKFVLSTYVPLLLFWLIIVMNFSLNF
jgi:hypothetical protein